MTISPIQQSNPSGSDVRKIDLTPIFKQTTFSELDIEQSDPIALAPFKTLIDEQIKTLACYILAIVQENNALFIFDATSLREWTIKENTNPLTKNKIDQIFYFIMQHQNDKIFEYLCDIKNEKIGWLNSFLNSKDAIGSRLNNLGLMLDKLKKFSKLELECYSKAIEHDKNSHVYLRNFALTYDQSNEVDQEKAFSYYKLAAEKGSTLALKDVGVRYMEGKGIRKNLALAIYYLHQAVKKEVAGAEVKHEKAIEESKNLEEQKMLKKLISRNKKRLEKVGNVDLPEVPKK